MDTDKILELQEKFKKYTREKMYQLITQNSNAYEKEFEKLYSRCIDEEDEEEIEQYGSKNKQRIIRRNNK